MSPGGQFSKTSVLMMFFGGFSGTPKILQKSLRTMQICFRNKCEFKLGFGAGSGRAPWRNAGSAALSPAGWLGNPRALPDFRPSGRARQVTASLAGLVC